MFNLMEEMNNLITGNSLKIISKLNSLASGKSIYTFLMHRDDIQLLIAATHATFFLCFFFLLMLLHPFI